MLIENPVNAGQGSVVENQNIETEVNASAEGAVDLQKPDDGAGVGENQQPGDVAKPHQSSEENSKFAELRRASEKATADYNTIKGNVDKLLPGLKEFGFTGETLEDVVAEMEAQKRGISVEEYRNSEVARQNAIDEAVRNHPAVKEAERAAREAQFAKDLAAVKAAFPDVTANSVTELGEVFLAGMRGGLSAEDAYAAQLAHDNRNKKEVPQKIGGIQQKFEPEAEFYTEEELNAFEKDPKAYDDPKVLKKALASLKRLGK